MEVSTSPARALSSSLSPKRPPFYRLKNILPRMTRLKSPASSSAPGVVALDGRTAPRHPEKGHPQGIAGEETRMS